MPTPAGVPRLVPRLGAAVAAVALLSACATSVTGTPAAEGQSGSSGDATGPDACSLFSPAEIKELIGTSPAGNPLMGEFGGGACQWWDLDAPGNNTLTVELGAPDTAPGGKLPEFTPENRVEALPDGMARDVLGRVYFVCGRNGECRVATTTTGGSKSENVKRSVALVPTIQAKTRG